MIVKKAFSHFAYYPGSDRARLSDLTFHSTIFKTRDERALLAIKNKLQFAGVAGADSFDTNASPDGVNVHDLEFRLGLRRINNPNLKTTNIDEAEKIW